MYQHEDNEVDHPAYGTSPEAPVASDSQETRLIIGLDYGTTFTGTVFEKFQSTTILTWLD